MGDPTREPVRPEDVLAGAQDTLVIDGVEVRKGTMGAVVSNARRLERLSADDPSRRALEDELRALAPGVRALGLLEAFAPRSDELARLLGEPRDPRDDVVDVRRLLDNCRSYWHGAGAGASTPEWFRMDIGLGVCNGVRRVDALGPGLWDRVAGAMSGVPWMWWVGPDSVPGVEEMLASHGAQRVGRTPVLSARLEQLDPGSVDGVEVREIEEDEVEQWVAAFASPNEVEDVDLPAYVAAERTRRTEPGDHLVRFAAVADGRFVGGSTAWVRDGVTGVYAVGVDEAYRRRGIGRVLTHAAAAAGAAVGGETITLQASPDGLPLYLAMGFTQVAAYDAWVPSSAA